MPAMYILSIPILLLIYYLIHPYKVFPIFLPLDSCAFCIYYLRMQSIIVYSILGALG